MPSIICFPFWNSSNLSFPPQTPLGCVLRRKLCSLHDDTMVKKVCDDSVRQILSKILKLTGFDSQSPLLQRIARLLRRTYAIDSYTLWTYHYYYYYLFLRLSTECNEELLYIRLGKPLMDKTPRRSSPALFLCPPCLIIVYFYPICSTDYREACSLG